MAASIAGVFWQLARLIRECRRAVRSCRRHNVKKRKADAAIAARLGAAGEAPVNPSPTARHITGGSQQGAYFPSGPVWKSTSELGYGDDVASSAWGACDLISTQVGPRRAAVGRPAADAHRGRERVARGGGALGLLRRRRRLPGLPAAATERVEGHVSRGLLVLPTDEESYANPPSIWRSVPPSERE